MCYVKRGSSHDFLLDASKSALLEEPVSSNERSFLLKDAFCAFERFLGKRALLSLRAFNQPTGGCFAKELRLLWSTLSAMWSMY